MKGESVLWIPGTDHAGIATQVAVEKQIRKNLNLTKNDLGREEFSKKVWEWKEDKEGRIIKQLRQMGASLDWTKQAFTMDSVSKKTLKIIKSSLNFFFIIFRVILQQLPKHLFNFMRKD